MAKNVLITEEVSCDHCNEGLGQDEGRTDHWSVNGEHLEMDLCAQCQALFEADIEKWVRISRPDGKGYRKEEAAKTTGTVTRSLGDAPPGLPSKRPAPKAKSAAKSRPEGKRTRQQITGWRIGIRKWAKEQGYEINEKGAVPAEIRDAWDEAHPEIVAAHKREVAAKKQAAELDLLNMDEDKRNAA